MAIDTNNEKLAIMELEDVWESAIPISPGAFGQDDKQQLIWGYPGVLWEAEQPTLFPPSGPDATFYVNAEIPTFRAPRDPNVFHVPGEGDFLP